MFPDLSSLSGLKTALLVDTVGNCAKDITSFTFGGIFPSAVLTDGTRLTDAPTVNSQESTYNRRLRQMDFSWTDGPLSPTALRHLLILQVLLGYRQPGAAAPCEY